MSPSDRYYEQCNQLILWAMSLGLGLGLGYRKFKTSRIMFLQSWTLIM